MCCPAVDHGPKPLLDPSDALRSMSFPIFAV
jgi:hypothetical protein